MKSLILSVFLFFCIAVATATTITKPEDNYVVIQPRYPRAASEADKQNPVARIGYLVADIIKSISGTVHDLKEEKQNKNKVEVPKNSQSGDIYSNLPTRHPRAATENAARDKVGNVADYVAKIIGIISAP